MIIITAYNEAMQEAGGICLGSIIRYHQKYPGAFYACKKIPDDFPRPPSWYKVGMIRRYLEEGHDCVLWVDADTIIRPVADIEKSLTGGDIDIAVDDNGINCGVMAWKRNEKTIRFLAEIDASEEFVNNIWWEQAAIMSRLHELCVHYQPKHLFNAYPEDATPESWILHWPGMTLDERIPLMKEAFAEI